MRNRPSVGTGTLLPGTKPVNKKSPRARGQRRRSKLQPTPLQLRDVQPGWEPVGFHDKDGNISRVIDLPIDVMDTVCREAKKAGLSWEKYCRDVLNLMWNRHQQKGGN